MPGRSLGVCCLMWVLSGLLSEPWERLLMFTAEPHNSLNFSKPSLSIVWHEVRKAGSAESEKVSNPAQGDSLPSFITAMNERLFQASP